MRILYHKAFLARRTPSTCLQRTCQPYACARMCEIGSSRVMCEIASARVRMCAHALVCHARGLQHEGIRLGYEIERRRHRAGHGNTKPEDALR
jgi:hypothetical protein